jgi:hypothetical protein
MNTHRTILSSAGRGKETFTPFLIDNSLSILNRTGAYYLAKDICSEFVPKLAQVRYWRLGSRAPEGLLRKLAARLMMLEIACLKDSRTLSITDEADGRCFRLFLDPLYVLRSRLAEVLLAIRLLICSNCR